MGQDPGEYVGDDSATMAVTVSQLLRVAAHNQVCALAGVAVSQPGELSLPGQHTTQLLFAVRLQTWREKNSI